MKLLVISDTHGNLEKACEVYQQLSGVDVLIHLGDCQRDAQELKRQLGVDVISVRGNMDRAYTPKEFTVFPVECGNLYLAHGHMENVKTTYQNILYRAEEENCIAALFGHTHKPLFAEAGGIYLINPGSLSLPAEGGPGTYALLTTSPEGLEGAIWQLGSDKPLLVRNGRGQENTPGEHKQAGTAEFRSGYSLSSECETETGYASGFEPTNQGISETKEKKAPSNGNKVQGGYLRKLLNYSDRF